MSYKKKLIHVEYNMKANIKNIMSTNLTDWKYEIDNDSLDCKYFNYIPDEILNEYCSKLSYIENSMPDEPGNEKVVIDPLEIKAESNILSFILFYNGEIIGISRFYMNPINQANIGQWQFGIYKNKTGNGFAKYLLSVSYLYLMNTYKELKYITVDTHPSNKIMINLLERIGYKYTHTEKIYEE